MVENGFIGMIKESIKNNGDNSAFTDYQGDSFTYTEVGNYIAQLHAIYHSLKIKEGDKIAVVGRNMSTWAIAYLSVVTYGAVVVPILPDFSANDVHHIVNHSGSVFLFSTELQFDKIDRKEMPALKGILSLPDFKSLYDPGSFFQTYMSDDSLFKSDIETANRNADDPMVLSYTSGTSGFSKGVLLPHRSIWSNVQFAHDNFDLVAGDRIVSFLPLAHAYGCLFEFLWPFTIGCHITFITKTPSPRIILEVFQLVKPNLILSVPLIIEKIFKKNIQPQLEGVALSTILKVPLLNKLIHNKINKKLKEIFGGEFREIIIGGAALNHEVEEFLRTIGFPFTIGYGMTECGPLISYSSASKTRLKSAGRIVDRMQIKIDSSDPYNEVGEILVKGDNTTLGYYKNKTASDELFDADGWIHTGDLGVIDADNFVYIKGRSKNMILGGSGQNIYPEEIEALLNNYEFVLESLVRDMGDGRLEALIYPDYETADNQGLDDNKLEEKIQGIKTIANKELPTFMALTKITLFPEEFEKTPKRSIKRFVYNLT